MMSKPPLAVTDRLKFPDLPGTHMTWQISERSFYTPENLWDYIDGGAELFLSYGFTAAQTVRYSAEGQHDIIVEKSS